MNEPSGEKQHKPTAFDIITKLILPGLSVLASILASILAMIVVQRGWASSRMLWGLLTLAFLFIGISFYPLLALRIHNWRNEAKDERLARRKFDELGGFVREFRGFVESAIGGTETLYDILVNATHSNIKSDPKGFNTLCLEPYDAFKSWCFYLWVRWEGQGRSVANFVDLVNELNGAVSVFSNRCVMPFFDNLPHDLRPALSESARSNMEAFRERFVSFQDRYVAFVRKVGDSLTEPRVQLIIPCRPKPL